MKSSDRATPKTCPKCGREYTAPSALSREDNSTYICPKCGTKEALAYLGIDEEEQKSIVDLIYAHGNEAVTSYETHSPG